MAGVGLGREMRSCGLLRVGRGVRGGIRGRGRVWGLLDESL